MPAAGETIIADGKELLTDAPGEKAEGTSVAIPPIPPYAENYEVIGVTAYTEPVTIYQFHPHAHLRGKDFKYTVVYPDGREETVLSVPKYDFHWQLAYELETAAQVAGGQQTGRHGPLRQFAEERASAASSHDASDSAHNPGPEKEVYFREANQSWDEMFTPFIQYSIDSEDPAKPPRPQPSPSETTKTGQPQEQPKKNALEIAEVVGCLEERPAGTWMVSKAGEPTVSKIQATSSVALKAVASRPLGDQQDQLLGVGVFNPSSQKGKKVAVKGVLIKNAKDSRLNVTSLQPVATTCF